VKECDRLSLVTYDTGVKLEFGLTSMTKANKDRTKMLIKKITDGSCTNLCGGLMEGRQGVVMCQQIAHTFLSGLYTVSTLYSFGRQGFSGPPKKL